MPVRIVRFEATPNPNALKCWLDSRLSDGPLSYRCREDSPGHGLVRRLFDEAGVTTLLFNGDWMTINKPQESDWRTIKQQVRRILLEEANP